ncbi:MAG: glutaminyl-peptide cyclotransferase [Actinomycetota bacterium]
MRRILLVGALLVGALLLAACSDGDDVPSTSLEVDDAAPATEDAVAPPTTTASTSPPDAEPSDAASATTTPAGEPVRLVPEVIETIAREPDAFTQGLELVDDGIAVESSGLYGSSFLRLVDPSTWEELEVVPLPDDVFAEGATVVDDRVIVLTWRENVAFVHELDGLGVVGRLTYPTEGWGLCELDDGRLAMSDGSATITFRDRDLVELSSVTVTLDGEPIGLLNELECVGDDIWANVWQTEDILRIDAGTGRVEAVVDADGLLEPDPADADADDVLNGIAHLGDDRFLITGKRWPAVFEVRFVPAG